MKCPKCKYVWNARTKKPKECPRCKKRLDVLISKRKSDEVAKQLQ